MTQEQFKRAEQIKTSIEFYERLLPRLDHVCEIKIISKEKKKIEDEFSIGLNNEGTFTPTALIFIDSVRTDMQNRIAALHAEFEAL